MLSFPSHCAVCGQPWFINHDCPPAGASQEANGAESLAAPAPGQRAGTPPTVFVVSWMERSLRRRASDWKERIVMFDNYDSAVRAAQAAKARGWCPGIVRRMAR